jgi:Zn-dependent protease with chaperone function
MSPSLEAPSGSRIHVGTMTSPAQPVPVRIELALEPDAALARTEAGVVHRIAYAELRVEAGGFDGEFLFLRGPDGTTFAVHGRELLDALARAGGGALEAQLDAVRQHHRGRRRGRMLSMGGVALALVLVGLAFVRLPTFLASSVGSLPPSVDRALGDAAAADVTSSARVLRDPRITALLDEAVRKLEPHARSSEHRFRVTALDDPTMNAFALPGGAMYFHSGLLAKVESPEEVAGVMAHEMAHVTLRHGLHNVARKASATIALRLLLGDAEGWVALAGSAAALAAENDYSRDQESAADAEGARMLLASGIGTAGMVRVFERLGEAPEAALADAFSWLGTHPDLDARIRAVREASGGEAVRGSVTWTSSLEAAQAALALEGAEGPATTAP